MGLFDKNKRTTTNTIDTTYNQADNRLIESGADRAIMGGNITINGDNNSGGGEGGGGINIQAVDLGALDTASDIADGAFDLSKNSLNQVGESVGKAVDALRETASEAVRDESARTQQFIILGLTISAVAFFFSGKIKKAFK